MFPEHFGSKTKKIKNKIKSTLLWHEKAGWKPRQEGESVLNLPMAKGEALKKI